MPSLKQITTKIKSVRSTRRIMGAMKLIAAVRLQKAQAALMAYRPYSDAYRDVGPERSGAFRIGGSSPSSGSGGKN